MKPGFIVPDYLKAQWEFVEGDSLAEIPKRRETFDFYLHDSDHSMGFLSAELAAALPRLSSSAVIIADDIDWSNAFFSFCVEQQLSPLLLTDNGKDNLRVRAGLVKLDHPRNSVPAITGRALPIVASARQREDGGCGVRNMTVTKFKYRDGPGAEEADFYREHGYLYVEGFYDRESEVDPIRRDIYELLGLICESRKIELNRGPYNGDEFDEGLARTRPRSSSSRRSFVRCGEEVAKLPAAGLRGKERPLLPGDPGQLVCRFR